MTAYGPMLAAQASNMAARSLTQRKIQRPWRVHTNLETIQLVKHTDLFVFRIEQQCTGAHVHAGLQAAVNRQAHQRGAYSDSPVFTTARPAAYPKAGYRVARGSRRIFRLAAARALIGRTASGKRFRCQPVCIFACSSAIYLIATCAIFAWARARLYRKTQAQKSRANPAFHMTQLTPPTSKPDHTTIILRDHHSR